VYTVDTLSSYIGGEINGDFSTALLNTDHGMKILHLSTKSCTELSGVPLGLKTIKTSFSASTIVGAWDQSSVTKSGSVFVASLSNAGVVERSFDAALHPTSITCLMLSSDQKILFTAGGDGSLCVTELNQNFVDFKGSSYIDNIRHFAFDIMVVHENRVHEIHERISRLQNEVRPYIHG